MPEDKETEITIIPKGLHATEHESGGIDEINVTDLVGILIQAQYAIAHSGSHENGGADEISAAGLSGLLADDQHVLDAEVLAVAAALVHAARHENGGADEISAAGLSGLLADDQHVLNAEVLAVAEAIGVAAGLIATHAALPNVHHTPPSALTVGEVEVHNGASPVAWTDLDLSGTVGSNYALVLIKVIPNAGAGQTMAFRKNGDTDEFYAVNASIGCALGDCDLSKSIVFLVATDSAGVIEWKAEIVQNSTIDVIAFVK